MIIEQLNINDQLEQIKKNTFPYQILNIQLKSIDSFIKKEYSPQSKGAFISTQGETLVCQWKVSHILKQKEVVHALSIIYTSQCSILVCGLSHEIQSILFEFPSIITYYDWNLSFKQTVVYLVARRIFLKKKRNNNLVSKIYLLEDGQVIQVHFANKIYRQLKGIPSEKLLFVSNMLTPDSTTDRRPIPDSVQLFPETQNEQKRNLETNNYAWAKYYLNWESFLMIPTKPDYVNMDVLTQIFQGKKINV